MRRWATADELEALAKRIEANRIEQLQAVNDALTTILTRLGDVEEQIETHPRLDPNKSTDEPQSAGGFRRFSARKRDYERAHRKDQK